MLPHYRKLSSLSLIYNPQFVDLEMYFKVNANNSLYQVKENWFIINLRVNKDFLLF